MILQAIFCQTEKPSTGDVPGLHEGRSGLRSGFRALFGQGGQCPLDTREP